MASWRELEDQAGSTDLKKIGSKNNSLQSQNG
jgi:hypothetical protein